MAREGGRLPMAIAGLAEPRPLDYRLPVASAQVKSAVLLAGLNAQGQTRVEEPVATRDHTENMLRHFGAHVKVQETPQGGGLLCCKAAPTWLRAMWWCRGTRPPPPSPLWRPCWCPVRIL